MSKHTKAAEGQACIRYGIEDGTTVLAHYEGKTHDLAICWARTVILRYKRGELS